MEDIKQYISVAKLICKRKLFRLSDSEEKLLDAWRQEAEIKERVFLNLQNISVDELEKRYELPDVDEKWEHFKKIRSRKQRRLAWGFGVAASICLLVAVALGYWTQRPVEEKS